MASEAIHEAVRVDVGVVSVDGDLRVPDRAAGLVIFAHGSGSSRFSRRNRAVAGVLEAAGFGTLLLDLLTPDEESVDERTREYRFDIDLISSASTGNASSSMWVLSSGGPDIRSTTFYIGDSRLRESRWPLAP